MSADEAVKEENRRRRRRQGSEPESGNDDAEMMEEDEMAEDAEGRQVGSAITERKGRATPGRRNRKSVKQQQEESGNAITRPFRGIIEYFYGVRDELEKVVWPTREELIRLTRIVLMVTIASALALGAIAFAFTELFILGFDNEWIFAVFFLVVGAVTFIAMRMNPGGTRPYR